VNTLPLPSEAEVLRQVLRWLELARIPHWRANCGSVKIAGRFIRFNADGVSDVLGLLPPSGRFLAIECKRKGGRVRPKQRAFLANVEAAGGLAVVVQSIDELAAALAPIGAGTFR
jgi:hypothetical protein